MSTICNAPLRLTPYYAEALWGGSEIARRFNRTGLPPVCSESWEISGHPSHPGIVAEGPYAGKPLTELVEEFGCDLIGTSAPDPRKFPLLVKLIDAQKRLSLQVHPNEQTAKEVGGEPKTEMWYVVGAAPGASIYAGVRWSWPPMDKAELRAAIESNTAEPLLTRFEVKPGDSIFIPGGLAHAICEGCLIFEIQQSSDTTYRLSDWGRVDANGKPRQLHLDQGLQAVDTGLPTPTLRRNLPSVADGANAWTEILSCPIFRLRRLDLRETTTIPADPTTFLGVFCLDGAAMIAGASIHAGESLLVPACAPDTVVEPTADSATLFLITLGKPSAE